MRDVYDEIRHPNEDGMNRMLEKEYDNRCHYDGDDARPYGDNAPVFDRLCLECFNTGRVWDVERGKRAPCPKGCKE